MATCRMSGIDFITSYFSPHVVVLCSHDAESLCAKNNLTVVEMLQPFSRLPQEVHVRDSSSITHVVKNLRVVFQDFNSIPPQPTLTKKLLNDVVANSWHEPSTVPIRDGNHDLHIPASTPWFEVYREVFLTTLWPSDHEFLKYSLACIFVVSTSHADPMDQFQKLTQQQSCQQHQQPNKLPKWFCPNVIRYYLLVHDLSDGDQGKADSVFQTMKSTYGPALCYLLQLNSRPDHVAQTLSSDLPDPWCQFILGCTDGEVEEPQPTVERAKDVLLLHDDSLPCGETRGTLPHPLAPSPSLPERLASLDSVSGQGGDLSASPSLPQLRNGCQLQMSACGSLGPAYQAKHGLCLTQEDHERLRTFVHEFVVRALIPWVERTMKALSEQVASKMRISRSLFTATKKWFGSSNPSSFANSGNKSVSDANLNSHVTGGLTSVVYTQEAPELQMRRYADLAFMFQQYEVAHQTYNALKKDFQNDTAWLHNAGAMEMSALSVLLQGGASQRQYPHHYVESAILCYLQTCKNPHLASRATFLNVEALKSKRMFAEASVQFVKMATEDSDLRSALFLEQAAYCYLQVRNPMVRKYAFHIILAGHRFSKCGQRKHALRCYQQALQVYHDMGWSLAEDHIHFTIGRHSFHLKRLANAADSLKALLHMNSHQNPMQQASMLKEFIYVYKQHLQSVIGNKTLIDGEFPKLPVPYAVSDTIKVLLGKPLKEIEEESADEKKKDKDVMVEARGVQFLDEDLCDSNWAKLEEVLVSSCHDDNILITNLPTQTCFTNVTRNDRNPLSVVGESVTLQCVLKNPLDVPLVLTDLFLLWRFAADSDAKPITNETEREHLLAAKEVVTTEVLADFYLLPCERKPVELSVTPKTVGNLRISGLAFSLGASAPSQHSSHVPQPSTFLGTATEDLPEVDSVRVKGSVRLQVQGRRKPVPGPPTYSSDLRLDLRVVEAMPMLRVAFSEFPEALLCGEVRLINMQVSNVGQQPLTKLRLTTNLSGILTFGFDEYVHMLNTDVYQTLAHQDNAGDSFDVLCDKPSVKEFIEVPLASPGVLVPGGSVSLPCWLRGPDTPGKTQVKMLFYYESTEPSQMMKYRVLRHRCELEVLPSLRLKSYVRRSQGSNSNNLVLTTETENSYSPSMINTTKSLEFDVLQVSSASQYWSLKAITDSSVSHRPSLKPQESFCLNFLLNPSKLCASGSSSNQSLFSSLRIDRSNSLINAGGSPCADFYFRTRRKRASEEPATPLWRGKSACEVELTLILLWKARQSNMDGSSQTFVGQNHVDITMIEKWFCEPEIEKGVVTQDPVRFFSTFVEADPAIHMQPLFLQSKLIRTNFNHPAEVSHDFGKNRYLIVQVDVSLYNTASDPVVVRIDANDHEISERCISKFQWIGTTEEEISLAAKSSSVVSLRACFSSPGVYDLFKLIVKAAFSQMNNEKKQSVSDIGFVKQDYSYSSLITVLSVAS